MDSVLRCQNKPRNRTTVIISYQYTAMQCFKCRSFLTFPAMSSRQMSYCILHPPFATSAAESTACKRGEEERKRKKIEYNYILVIRLQPDNLRRRFIDNIGVAHHTNRISPYWRPNKQRHASLITGEKKT